MSFGPDLIIKFKLSLVGLIIVKAGSYNYIYDKTLSLKVESYWKIVFLS